MNLKQLEVKFKVKHFTDNQWKWINDRIYASYKQGEKEGQAKMKNSGRLLYQQGVKDCLGKIPDTVISEDPYEVADLKYLKRQIKKELL